MNKRATIADIAKRAGVSKGAVSYALNGLPGVSEETRQRVLALATEMGWHPNSAARALSAARAGAFGLVLARPASLLGVEPFFMKLISGMEEVLAAQSIALLIQVVPDHDAEAVVYRRWWGEHRVDGVFLVDLLIGDPRVAVLEELGLPAVVVGGPGHHGKLPGVWIDDGKSMFMVVEYLAALGHRRITRVAGPTGLLHTELRNQAFREAAAQVGLSAAEIVVTDYSAEQGAQATRELLSAARRPTAIVYENDVMAVAGMSVAYEMGVAVPTDVSIVAWDDSVLCEIMHPAITALNRDITAYGARAAERLLESPSTAAAVDGDVELVMPRLIVRGSTGKPAAPQD